MKANSLLQIFQEYLMVVKRLSDNSIYYYRYDLNKFKNFLDDHQIDLLKVQSEDVTKFIFSEKNRKVSVEEEKISRKRHLYKTVTWRIIPTTSTFIISFILTEGISVSLKIATVEFFSKMLFYYFPERVWFKVRL